MTKTELSKNESGGIASVLKAIQEFRDKTERKPDEIHMSPGQFTQFKYELTPEMQARYMVDTRTKDITFANVKIVIDTD